MALDPLRQPPLLHNQCRFFQFDKLATDVAAEELEFATDMGAFEELGRRAGEGGQTVGGSKGGVEFGGCSTEFLGVMDGGGVNGRGGRSRRL